MLLGQFMKGLAKARKSSTSRNSPDEATHRSGGESQRLWSSRLAWKGSTCVTTGKLSDPLRRLSFLPWQAWIMTSTCLVVEVM